MSPCSQMTSDIPYPDQFGDLLGTNCQGSLRVGLISVWGKAGVLADVQVYRRVTEAEIVVNNTCYRGDVACDLVRVLRPSQKSVGLG